MPDLNRHSPRMSIDLGALSENWRRVCSAVPSATVAAVVKRDAYGLGLETVAEALATSGCRAFFVEDADEGDRLRPAVPGAEIYLLDPPRGVASPPFVPVIRSLDGLARAAPGPIALLIDSGIGRLGLTAGDVACLAAEPSRLRAHDVRLIMTHLAGFTRPADPENRAQFAAFRALAASLPPAPLSAATSSFVFEGPEWHLDLVRVGSALYGIRSAMVTGYDPLPVIRVEAPVVGVRVLPAGAPLGYYRRRGDRPLRIATIALGYADGLPPGFTRRAAAYLDGERVPFVAEATMTLTTIDVTALPPDRPAPGDWVEIIGPNQDANVLGAALGVNPNRLLTVLGACQRRRYHSRPAVQP